MSASGNVKWGRQGCLVAIAGLVLCLGGCNSSSKTANASKDYIASYTKGEYADAYRESAKAAMDSENSDRDRAALIAGQAAHAQGNYSDSQRWLRPLLDSESKQIAGQSAATLGLIAQQSGDQQQAADLLRNAGDKLTLDASAKSLLFAGDSLSRLGKKDEAKAAWETAQEKAKYDAELQATITARLAGGPVPPVAAKGSNKPTIGISESGKVGQFTLQSGVFSTLSRAVRAADEITPKARKAGFEAPRVVNTIDSKGRQLYAVRFGKFPTKSSADFARSQFGSQVIATQE